MKEKFVILTNTIFLMILFSSVYSVALEVISDHYPCTEGFPGMDVGLCRQRAFWGWRNLSLLGIEALIFISGVIFFIRSIFKEQRRDVSKKTSDKQIPPAGLE
jgi:hypothetical protein